MAWNARDGSSGLALGPGRKAAAAMKRHVVLIGLPGSGKSTVGALLAEGLGVSLVDLDRSIERRAGRTIADLFTLFGERHFRELERREMEAVLAGEPCVVAPGGGWAAQPGNLEGVRSRAYTIYLVVSPEVAARRLGESASARPLLAGDPVGALRRLLVEREACYRRAEAVVATDGMDPAEVADRVLRLARSAAGWY